MPCKKCLHDRESCPNQYTVSIYGETGSGKEMIAKAIHYHSRPAEKAFVAVNVAAIPATYLKANYSAMRKSFHGRVTRPHRQV